MQTYTLSNNVEIPAIGMGTWPLKGNLLKETMKHAIKIGYRMFDTADNYDNETDIGEIIASKIVPREELFITTKISDEKNNNCPWASIGKYFYKSSSYMKEHSAREVVEMLVNKSLKSLNTDYIDCLIIHWPYPDYLLEIWDSMCILYKAGKLRSIGVSNCRERHIEKIIKNSSICPMVNQISISPLDTRETLLKYNKEHNIRTMCYAPLMQRNNNDLIQADIIKHIMSKYNITIEQLLLIWNVNQGVIPIPKSSSEQRLKNNYNVFSIRFTEQEIKNISKLNQDLQYLPESKYCPGL